jgi:hypothetical protein
MKKEGYLFIDHRFSPGLPEDLARSQGFDPSQIKEGKQLEAATLTCSHCKTVVVKNPYRASERSNCPKCSFHYICDFCSKAMREPDYDHTPFDKRVDQMFSDRPVLGSPPKLILP